MIAPTRSRGPVSGLYAPRLFAVFVVACSIQASLPSAWGELPSGHLGTSRWWISLDGEDVERLASNESGRAALAPLGNPVFSIGRTSVYRAAPDALSGLSSAMHERLRKCGGFFAYDSRSQAEASLAAAPAAPGGPYTLDQEALVRPLVARVSEPAIRSTIERLSAFHDRNYQSDSGVQAAEWLAARWREPAKALRGASVRLVAHTGWRQPSVILTIPGSESPGETVVLGAHLDTLLCRSGGPAACFAGDLGLRAPGADDDASGVAVLTEALRILAEAGFRPRRTLEFMAFAAEEPGLLGSSQIAREYRASGRRVAGMLQLEMTNFAGSGDLVYVLSDNTDFALTTFLRQLVDAYVGVPWAWTRCGHACSDHASWTRNGFPASAAVEAAFEAVNPAMHTEGDTLAGSGGNAAHSVKFARLAVAFAVEAAKPASALSFSPNAAAHGRHRP